MKTYQTIQREDVIIDSIVCNVCGRPSKKDEFGCFEEFVEINKRWGYYSEFDGEDHSFEICPDCYKKLIDEFTVPIIREKI